MFKSSPHPKHLTIRSSQKFLTKHTSSSSFMFFKCCRDVSSQDYQIKQTISQYCQPKVSIKQLKKKRQPSYLQEEAQSRSRSKKTKTSNKTSIQNLKRKNQKQNPEKIILPGQQGEILKMCEKSQGQPHSKQNNKHSETPVNNFNTTNYVVSQCLLQPHETNFIFQENPQIKATVEDELNSIFDSKNQNPQRYQLGNQAKERKKKDKKAVQNNIKQQLRSYANFSFGHRQKQEIFNKYLNKMNSKMKQSSNRLSQQSKNSQKMLLQVCEIDNSAQNQMSKLNENERNRFLRDTFHNKSLKDLVNTVGRNVFKSESQNSQSKESMVIDTHKSIIQKSHNPKEIHLVS